MLEQRDYEFVVGLQRSPVRFTYILLGINFLLFVLMFFAGGTTNNDTLRAFGAKWNPAIDKGEFWRFLTPVFLHIGILHILSNSYALWVVGPQVERLYGGGRYMLLYLGAGIAGVGASYYFNPQPLSAGASGAIFGLFGALLGFGLRHRNQIPPFFRQAVIRSVLPVIGINLLIGYSMSIVDNSAHIGGLVAGGLIAAMLPFQPPGETDGGGFRMFQAVTIGAIALAFFQVYRHYDGPPISLNGYSVSWTPSDGGARQTRDFVSVINEAQEAFDHSITAIASRETPRVAESMNETAAALDHLRRAPSMDETADSLIQDLLDVMESQYKIQQDVGRAGLVTFDHEIRARENMRRNAEIRRTFRDWVDTEGRRRGIELRQKK
ncbi:MAG TPA: rhomboid family intramembrane serine protease [Terriglobia bacterium]|nr:rhomboid family intramembrane serine protease [Terriglobia bacterium]